MAMGQAAGDGEGVMLGGDHGATLEHAAQAFDMGGRPAGEVAQRAFADLAARAVALTQQNGGGEVRVGTASIYIAGLESIRPRGTSNKRVITWLRFETVRSSFSRTSADL